MTSQLPQAQQQLAEAQGTEGTHTLNELFGSIKESTEKSANKLSHMEKRLMQGEQGYLIHEAMRQIMNTYNEWDVSRSQVYFEGCVHNQFMRWINSKGGRIEPNEYVWR